MEQNDQSILSTQQQLAYDQRMDEMSRWLQQNKRDFSDPRPAQEIALERAMPISTLESRFFNTPAYRLAFGSDPQMLDASADPTERFRADPGYEFQQQEGIRQLLKNHAAKGLLESGRSMRDVQGYAQNLANQQYGQFQQQNMGLFSDYQNRLQGLMGMGMQTSGADSANALGNNLGSLFANQGVFGASGMLNTGAAQGSNLMNAANVGAQIASANAAAGFGGGDTGAGSLGQSSTGVGGYF